jgi:hypothetical protein
MTNNTNINLSEWRAQRDTEREDNAEAKCYYLDLPVDRTMIVSEISKDVWSWVYYFSDVPLPIDMRNGFKTAMDAKLHAINYLKETDNVR